MNTATKELIFVYNADGDLFSQVTDFAHKIFSPQTYSCRLCSLTHGNFTMKIKWRDFLSALPYPKTFLHRDDFFHRFPGQRELSLPAIFLFEGERLRSLITSDEISTFSALDDLIATLQKKIETA